MTMVVGRCDFFPIDHVADTRLLHGAVSLRPMTLRVLNFTTGYSLGALFVLAQLATHHWRVANNQQHD